MVAITWLVAHTVVSTTRTEAAIKFFLFEQKSRRMDIGGIYLIIYIRTGEDMVNALPLAFISVGSSDTVLSFSILS